MSILRTSYLLYGFKLDKEKEINSISDHYEDLIIDDPYSKIFDNSESDQILVYDGMCQNYAYVGLKLASVDEYEEEPYVSISAEDVLNLKNKLEEKMKSWPDYLIDMVNGYEPRLYMFMHTY